MNNLNDKYTLILSDLNNYGKLNKSKSLEPDRLLKRLINGEGKDETTSDLKELLKQATNF